MIEDLDYEKVPNGFVHCFNKDCKRAASCLRYQASLHVPAAIRRISVLNPACLKQEGDCPEFVDDTPVKYAYGWTHMFDNLIQEKAVAIKNELLLHYGKSEFYRLKRKEKSFSPQAQQYVARVFRAHGVTDEPVYDSYQYEYMWKRD